MGSTVILHSKRLGLLALLVFCVLAYKVLLRVIVDVAEDTPRLTSPVLLLIRPHMDWECMGM